MGVIIPLRSELNHSYFFLHYNIKMKLIYAMGIKKQIMVIFEVHYRYPRVGVPTPPKMDYGQCSYGETYCNYIEHRGDSHPMYVGCLELYMGRLCTIIFLTTFVWLFVWGWKEVYLVSLVSNSDQRLDQNVLRSLFPWSNMMVYGIQN
jgi:hypothetical protein